MSTRNHGWIQLAGLIALGAAAGAAAQTSIGPVVLRGVEGELADNIRAQLSLARLTEAQRGSLREGRLAYLMRNAEDEVDLALQPFGYYHAEVAAELDESTTPPRVLVTVEPGEPTRVVERNVRVEGPGDDDASLIRAAREFQPALGGVMDHRLYEQSKARIERRLAARGYFDALLARRRVEVELASRQAEIELAWQTGVRYRYGEIRISGSHLRDDLVRSAIQIDSGEPFLQSDLLRLHQRLTDLDYFGYVDIRPVVDDAEEGVVPVAVELTPGKRSVYTAGVSFGTDSGAGVRLGLERRWVNDRGHKFDSALDFAQRRQSLGATYRIPAFAWVDGWYTFGANYREEESDSVNSEIAELLAQRTGRIGDWNLSVALHALQEDFVIADQRGSAQLVYPAMRAAWSRGDHPLYPRSGLAFSAELRTGFEAIGSDSDFVQFLGDITWIRGLGERSRLITRGQIGRTWSDDIFALPPSLRFFAGGDRSVRGYGYQEIGPENESGDVVGGKNLLVASAEFEQMFTDSWGAAVFVDAGNAFNDTDEGLRTGVGVGLRWRSPVGPVRLDLARGLDEPDSSIAIHINIGPEL